MRALVTRSYDGLEVIDIATPEPSADEVRIAVAAATVNPADAAVASGVFAAMIHQPDHVGLGWDAAGTITAIGSAVAASHPDLVVGARVAALSWGFDKPLGALAEELVVPAADVALVPEGLDLTSAATIPLNTLTADQAVALAGEPTGSLLVTGAAGAVGGYAAALASARGWKVVGLAREGDREFVESTGAELVTSLDGLSVDAALDAAMLRGSTLGAVRDGGTYVSLSGPVDGERGIEVQVTSVHADGARLAELLDASVSGMLPVRLDRTYPLDQVTAAFARVTESGVRGRVVVLP